MTDIRLRCRIFRPCNAAQIRVAIVVQILSETHDIPMVIDERALEEIGLSTDEPITVEAEGVSLRSLLRMMLNELDLTYNFQNEILVVTTIKKNRTEFAAADLLARGDENVRR